MKHKVLFLCTGNSARSILAEYLLRSMDSRFESYSAGADPTGKVHPVARKVLREDYSIDASDAESKSWTAFDDVDFDFVITVCDQARDTCPLWPGSSAILAHWGSPDPAGHRGDPAEIESVFRRVAEEIRQRLESFRTLPFEELSVVELSERLRRIGHQSLRHNSPATAAGGRG